tara:strand:+ start:284 stop:508 length:225 start_codon:yes stop_codon:yes gene_type:complete
VKSGGSLLSVLVHACNHFVHHVWVLFLFLGLFWSVEDEDEDEDATTTTPTATWSAIDSAERFGSILRRRCCCEG